MPRRGRPGRSGVDAAGRVSLDEGTRSASTARRSAPPMSREMRGRGRPARAGGRNPRKVPLEAESRRLARSRGRRRGTVSLDAESVGLHVRAVGDAGRVARCRDGVGGHVRAVGASERAAQSRVGVGRHALAVGARRGCELPLAEADRSRSPVEVAQVVVRRAGEQPGVRPRPCRLPCGVSAAARGRAACRGTRRPVPGLPRQVRLVGVAGAGRHIRRRLSGVEQCCGGPEAQDAPGDGRPVAQRGGTGAVQRPGRDAESVGDIGGRLSAGQRAQRPAGEGAGKAASPVAASTRSRVAVPSSRAASAPPSPRERPQDSRESRARRPARSGGRAARRPVRRAAWAARPGGTADRSSPSRARTSPCAPPCPAPRRRAGRRSAAGPCSRPGAPAARGPRRARSVTARRTRSARRAGPPGATPGSPSRPSHRAYDPPPTTTGPGPRGPGLPVDRHEVGSGQDARRTPSISRCDGRPCRSTTTPPVSIGGVESRRRSRCG